MNLNLALKIPLLKSVLERCGRRQRRQVIRGHRRLHASAQHSRILELKAALTEANFPIDAEPAAPSFFGPGGQDLEIIVRQYVLLRIGGLNLNRALLLALGGGSPVVHPLPARWRTIVRQHGFEIAEIRCAVLWYAYVAIFAGYGVGRLAGRAFAGFRESLRPSFPPLGRYAYFDSVTCSSLPQPNRDGCSHDIFSWYHSWSGRARDLNTLAHGARSSSAATLNGVALRSLGSPVPPVSRLRDLVRLVWWGFAALAAVAFDLTRGCWWKALLLSEAVKAEEVRLADPAHLAVDYLFHNSAWIYRPLWTYAAERRGARILFYFYSTNCESPKLKDGYPLQANSWEAMNWPHYLVWDEGQADFVRRAVGNRGTIQIVGPIWFQSSAVEVPMLPAHAVAVFDVQPVRLSFYATLGLAFDYYTPETAGPFLLDIHAALARNDGVLVLKRKRKIGNLAHPQYRKVVERISASRNFVAIDPEVSAVRVIEKAAGVISMPFTSTALLGRSMGKPSIYYDPHGKIQKDDRAAHGIQIVCGQAELNQWLSTLFESSIARPVGTL